MTKAYAIKTWQHLRPGPELDIEKEGGLLEKRESAFCKEKLFVKQLIGSL